MATKTLNAIMLSKFEEDILKHTDSKKWAEQLESINDMLTEYLLNDDDFVGNSFTAETMYHLRLLRDFFKELEHLEH